MASGSQKRTIVEVKLSRFAPDEILEVMAGVLEPLGYKQQLYEDGGVMWTRGDGYFSAQCNYRPLFQDGDLLIQVWVWNTKDEVSLERLIGRSSKKLRRELDEVVSRLNEYSQKEAGRLYRLQPAGHG